MPFFVWNKLFSINIWTHKIKTTEIRIHSWKTSGISYFVQNKGHQPFAPWVDYQSSIFLVRRKITRIFRKLLLFVLRPQSRTFWTAFRSAKLGSIALYSPFRGSDAATKLNFLAFVRHLEINRNRSFLLRFLKFKNQWNLQLSMRNMTKFHACRSFRLRVMIERRHPLFRFSANF